MKVIESAPKDFGDWMNQHGPKKDQPSPKPAPAPTAQPGGRVKVIYTNGDGDAGLYEMDAADARRIAEIVSDMRDDDGNIKDNIWNGDAKKVADEVFAIIGRSKEIDVFGHINADGNSTEGWFWEDGKEFT